MNNSIVLNNIDHQNKQKQFDKIKNIKDDIIIDLLK